MATSNMQALTPSGTESPASPDPDPEVAGPVPVRMHPGLGDRGALDGAGWPQTRVPMPHVWL